MDVLSISGEHMALYGMKNCLQSYLLSTERGPFLNIIKDIYSKSSSVVKVSNKRADFLTAKKGVRQGCPLSPMLFNIYTNVSVRGSKS